MHPDQDLARKFIMIGLALTLACVHPGPRFNFTEPAARLENLMPALSGVIGRKVECGASLKNEVLLLHFHQRTADDVLDRIANLEHASWVRDGDSLRLERNAKQDRELLVAGRKRAIDLLRAGLADRAKQLPGEFTEASARKVIAAADDYYRTHDLSNHQTSGNPQVDNDRQIKLSTDFEAVKEMGPANQFIEKCACLLDPDLYVDLTGDEQMVFSNQPTSLQHALPASLEGPFAQILSANNLIYDLRAHAGGAPKVPIQWGWDPSRPMERASAKECVFELTVTREAHVPNSYILTFEIRQADQTLLAASTRVAFGLEPPKLACFENTRPFSPSDVGTKNLAMEADTTLGAGPALHPERLDPLAITAGPDLCSVADQLHEDLFARLPDSVVRGSAYSRSGSKLTLGAALYRILASECRVSEEAGAITIEPDSERDFRYSRADRSALKELVTAASQKNHVPLDDLANFALTNNAPAFEGVAAMYVDFLLPGAGSALRTADVEGLRLFANLTTEERESLESGHPIAARRLSGPAQQQFVRIAYFVHSNPNMGPDDDFFKSIHLSRTSTGEFPVELPVTAVLKASRSVEPIALGVTTAKQRIYRSIVSISSLATVRHLAMIQGKTAESTTSSAIHFIPGERRRVTLSLSLDGKTFETRHLDEIRVDWRATEVAYSELPAAFQDAVARETERLRVERSNALSPATRIAHP